MIPDLLVDIFAPYHRDFRFLALSSTGKPSPLVDILFSREPPPSPPGTERQESTIPADKTSSMVASVTRVGAITKEWKEAGLTTLFLSDLQDFIRSQALIIECVSHLPVEAS